MQNPYDLSAKILDEVKTLAAEIGKSETVAGLISNYQKVQTLFEKVAFLKLLEEENIDLYQRKDELNAMIAADPTHSNDDEAIEKQKEVEAEYDRDMSQEEEKVEENFDIDAKADETNHVEENPVAEEKKNAIEPKTENIIVSETSEEGDFVDDLLKPEEQEAEKVEEMETVEEKPSESVSFTFEPLNYKEEEIPVEENKVPQEKAETAEVVENNHEVKEAVVESQPEEIVEESTKEEPEYQSGKLFADEEHTNDVTSEDEASNKVKLASIKGLKHQPEEYNGANIGGVQSSASTSNAGKIRLDLNDKMAFSKKLFNGDSDEMFLVMEMLNSFKTLDEAKEYLSDMYYERNWKNVDEYAQRLWSLVEGRFR